MPQRVLNDPTNDPQKPKMQDSAGQGTTPRLRRSPRRDIKDVSIQEASGLTLGSDGFPHPLETTDAGELKVTERSAVEVLEDILKVMTHMYDGMVLKDLIADVEEN